MQIFQNYNYIKNGFINASEHKKKLEFDKHLIEKISKVKEKESLFFKRNLLIDNENKNTTKPQHYY